MAEAAGDAETAESFVQLTAEGTGKQVRNLRVTRIVDGAEEIVYMQVVAIADEDGRLLRSSDAWHEAMLAEAVKTNELLQLLLQALG